MADAPIELHALLPTTQMRILKEVREVPEHHRTFTLVTVARCILESAAKPLIAEGASQMEALLAIAAFVPAAAIAAPLPGPVRAAFKEVNEGLGYTLAPAAPPAATNRRR
jgi:hypothetical protein